MKFTLTIEANVRHKAEEYNLRAAIEDALDRWLEFDAERGSTAELSEPRLVPEPNLTAFGGTG